MAVASTTAAQQWVIMAHILVVAAGTMVAALVAVVAQAVVVAQLVAMAVSVKPIMVTSIALLM